LVKHLKGIGGSGAIGFGPNRVESIADAVAKALEIHQQENSGAYAAHARQDHVAQAVSEAPAVAAQSYTTAAPSASTDLCTSCGSASLINVEGCKTCTNCGYSKCN